MSALGDLAAVLATTVSEVSYSVSESALNPGAVQTYREEFTVPRGWRATALADVVLASDWLAEYVATKQAEALREAADEIRRAQEEVGFPANHDRGVNYALMILDDRADRIAP